MKNIENTGIAIFDFDGTITRRDSMIAFIRLAPGNAGLFFGFVRLTPWLLAYAAGLISNRTMKEALLTVFLKNKNAGQLEALGVTFGETVIPSICYAEAIQKLDWHQTQGHEVVVITASPAIWTRPWCDARGYVWIGTELEIVGGCFTGKIVGENCRGAEKVRQLKARFSLEKYAHIYAYGNTKADLPFMQLAHSSIYKPFRH